MTLDTLTMKKTILIVEDDEAIVFALTAFLEDEGYNVLSAENGFVALELIRKHGAPHLILLDMQMPIMNGWQFALEFMDKFDHMSPIVVMTAAVEAEKRAKSISAIGWIGKPFKLDDLLPLIRKFERAELPAIRTG